MMMTSLNVDQLFNQGDKAGSIQKIMSSKDAEYRSLLANLILPYCLKTSSGLGSKDAVSDGSSDNAMEIVNGFSGVKEDNENRNVLKDVLCDGKVTLNELNDFASIMLVSENNYCMQD